MPRRAEHRKCMMAHDAGDGIVETKRKKDALGCEDDEVHVQRGPIFE